MYDESHGCPLPINNYTLYIQMAIDLWQEENIKQISYHLQING